MDSISREELKEAFRNHCFHNCYYCKLAKWDIKGACYICGLIDNAPTVPDFKEGYKQAIIDGKTNFSRIKGKWGKWAISEIQCPNCLEYFQTDCYSMGELKKCPCCEAKLIGEEEQS